METIMQVLSETRHYWLPVALAVVSVALGYSVKDVFTTKSTKGTKGY